jgi:peptide deformylase
MPQTKTKKVILDPHPSLHKESAISDPKSQEIKELIDTMRSTLKEWEEGEKHYVSVGLAAVQIDELKRVVLIRKDFHDYSKSEFYALINPEITKYEGLPTVEDESCMSVHGVHAKVPRYPKIKLIALDEDGNQIKFTAKGYEAKVLQHEVDHTNGLLFLDRALTESQGGYFKEYDPKSNKVIDIAQSDLIKRGIFNR